MKIALLGNMNNNNFSIMRYFRDLGVDAHLLTFANDGSGSLGHFRPEDDTWELERWSPYIHQIDIDNGITSIVGWPKNLKLRPTRSHIQKVFSDYDVFIGSGITPALLQRIGLSLHIFYPYATGIEHVGTHELMKAMRRSLVHRLVLNYVRRKQVAAIKQAKYCINAELGMTKSTFEAIGKSFLPMAIPMVYNREESIKARLRPEFTSIASKINGFEFKILSHSRLLWVRDPSFSQEEWEKCSKHNDWLVTGYAKFIKQHPNSILVLFEYGSDVDSTKKMCAELGLDNSILWLPKMPRKEILCLLGLCDVGVGEFYLDPGTIWGGTGWEVLATGKPLLQSLNFTESEYIAAFGHPPPPILDAKSPESITAHLIDMHENKDRKKYIGSESITWFDKYNGIGLSKRWLDLITTA